MIAGPIQKSQDPTCQPSLALPAHPSNTGTPNAAGFKPNWPALPAKSTFTAVPIADPDTHPSLEMAQKNHKGKKQGPKKVAPTPIPPADLAKGPYKRVSHGVYELRDNSHNASRANLPPPLVSCDEGEVKVVTLFDSISLDKDYGTYLVVWDKGSGFRKLPKTPAEPKDLTIREVMEFRLDAENAARKSPNSQVAYFIKNHTGFYDDPLFKAEHDIHIKESVKAPPQPSPLPHSVLSVTVAQLPFTDALDVRFRGEYNCRDYTIGYEITRGGRNGSGMVKMVDGASEKLKPSNKERSAFVDAVKAAYKNGDRKVVAFVSQYPDTTSYPPIF